MGRHSRRVPADTTDDTGTTDLPRSRAAGPNPGPGTGRRRRAPGADGTPAHGTPVHGVPHVRGGHPEQREPGGGWGDLADTGEGAVARTDAESGAGADASSGADAADGGDARSSDAGPDTGASPRITGAVRIPRPRRSDVPGPRQDYVAAFPDDADDADDADGADDTDADSGEELGTAGAPKPATQPPPPRDPYASVTDWSDAEEAHPAGGGGDFSDGAGADDDGKGGKGRGRLYAGIAAAAVTTVLAVVVAGQVTGGGSGADASAKASPGGPRDTEDPASRSDRRPAPADAPAAPVTYDQKMGKKYPLDPKAQAKGDFEAISGFDKAPGKGQKFRYRVDVEKGLGLDGELFAQAVQKTLNDDRSWAHAGARTFERISSGRPDFVITLASPGTTGKWCAKSGLDTTQDNVSCDSAATERVMINAYRWAQGAKTYGDAIHPYRQMLINHEVGHRLGHNHTDCTEDGALAPVMQQQTKFLDHDGIKCKPNPWVFPKS
ncbi:DUF3152 domain-containing protein [Streptomyces sp. NPDC002564]|uniref:DUF3152 domain-containing protein n=1 Tax=Streptomyces sp. NPDC002564 TaxID=3364649 RepID=UPI00369B18A1